MAVVFPLERRPILANDGAANGRLGSHSRAGRESRGGKVLEHAAGESSIRGPALRPAVLILLYLVAAVVAGRLLDRGWASLLAYQPLYEPGGGDASEGPHLTHKLVLVVIDGLSLDRSRQMRTLNRLRSAGADFDCATGVPACSSSARVTLATGAWPELHGILTEEPRRALSIDNLFRAAGRVGGSRAIAGSASWSRMFGPDLGDADMLATPMVERRSAFRAAETALLVLERQAAQFVVSRQARLGILELNVADLAAREQGARSPEYARASLEADRMLGQLADGLSLWTTTLVVTSDHGQPGQPGVPLVMTGRAVRAGVVGAARQIDVAPTISALLGLPIPAASQGRTLSEAFDAGPEKVAAVLQRQRAQKQAFARAYAASIGESAVIQAGAEAAPDVDALMRSIHAIDDQVDAARQARMSPDRSSRLPVAGVALVAAALALLIVYGRGPRTAPIAGVIGTAAWAAGIVLLEARLGARPLPPAFGCGDVGPLLTRVAAASFVCALFGSGFAVALARLRQAQSSPVEQCLLGLAPISGAVYVLAMRVAYAYWQQGLSPTWFLGDVGLRLQSLADLARLRAVACAALLVPALAWVAGRVARSRAPALAILALLVVAAPIEAAGAIYTDVPERVDASKRYLFYLHGRIVELQGRKAVSPEFGPYEYDAILQALAEPGFEVISEIRPASTGLEYAKKVAAAVRRLLLAKVPADHVTVAGFSKGGGLTLATAAELGEPRVNFVVMAICAGDTATELAGRVKGRMLSIYDASDKLAGSCARVLPQGTAGTSHEIVLHVGRGHGTFFTPRKEWLDPLRDWALGK